MLLQRKKKKELWRYASKNCSHTGDGMQENQQRQLPHLQHPRRPPHNRQQNLNSLSLPPTCCNDTSSITEILAPEVMHCNTPPPPYSVGVFGNDYSGSSSTQQISCGYSFRREQQPYATDAETETSTSAAEDTDYFRTVPNAFNKKSSNCEIFGENVLIEDCQQSNDSNKNVQLMTQMFKLSNRALTPPIQYPTISNAAIGNNFVTTAASVFRNCCGCGFFGDSSTTLTISSIPSLTLSQTSTKNHSLFDHSVSSLPMTENVVIQDFNILMKQLKNFQIATLLKAVKSRKSTSTNSTSGGQHTNCILIKRTLSVDEEPHLKACRLFFWNDIKTTSELKRLPVCASEQDTIYMCCNPLHWCRIIPREIPPPPYQRLNTKERILEGDSDMQSNLWIRLPESLSTDGNDRQAYQLVWCEVAYWELAQRVGARHKAKKASFNIYNDSSDSNELHEDMCLKSLAEEKVTPTSQDVHNTRLKIGLGVTLSRETDGIWLYNRSTVPIFLNSPTLRESWSRAFKVMPGDCLKAFDSIRAQTFDYPAHFPDAEPGPIDNNSMRISFAKGWGCDYKRQDITRCPCWLEIIFTQQR